MSLSPKYVTMRLCLIILFTLASEATKVSKTLYDEDGTIVKNCPCKTYAKGICIEYEDCRQGEARVDVNVSADHLLGSSLKGVAIKKGPGKPSGEPQFAPLFKAASTPNCEKVLIRDTGYVDLNGIYDVLSSPQNDCNGRWSYSQMTANYTLYMYHINYGWVIGLRQCPSTTNILMHASSTADFPDMVQSGNWTVIETGELVSNPNAKVLCARINCNSVEMTGMNYQKARSGTYSIMANEMCSGRPVFRHSSGQHYLYFVDPIWLVGPEKCTDVAGMHVIDVAYAPDGIMADWKEYYGQIRAWVTNRGIKIRCLGTADTTERPTVMPTLEPISCEQIEMDGFRYESAREGTYDRVPGEVCFGRPVFRQTSSQSEYLFFYMDEDSPDHWVIGPNRCEAIGGIRAVDAAQSPEKVSAEWEEVSPFTDTWDPRPSASARCRLTSTTVRPITPRTPDTTERPTVRPTPKPCQQIEMDGFRYQSAREGTYDRVPGVVCFGRPVFRQTSSQSEYLFFYKDEDGPDHWVIGPNRCEALGGIRAGDAAHSPEKVSAEWEEVNSFTKRWDSSPRGSARCRSRDVHSGGGRNRAHEEYLAAIMIIWMAARD